MLKKLRTFTYIMMYILAATLLVAGCSRQPEKEMAAASVAIDAAVGDGAEKFAPSETKMLQDGLSAATDEIRAQNGKFFKDFKRAREMLLKVRTDAEALKAALPSKKETARINAVNAGKTAEAALAEAKNLVARGPRKGMKVHISDLKIEVQNLDGILADIRNRINEEDYNAAVEKAIMVKDRASNVSGQLKDGADRTIPKKSSSLNIPLKKEAGKKTPAKKSGRKKK
ncbi:MAG: DUF4398 domain-containing protein [Nitrospirae bacterium]|nr:DUF4398 domain-containing protein [Nitrospirota bacterium]